MTARPIKQMGDVGLARRKAAELNRVEAHKVENVLYVHILQINGDGIVAALGSHACHLNVLVATADGQIVDLQVVLTVNNTCGMNGKQGVANGQLRLAHVETRLGDSMVVLAKLNHGKQTALETMATGVVVEPDFGRQLVLLGRRVDLQIGSDAIRTHLDSLDLSAQVLIRRRNANVHLTKMAVAVNDIRGMKL